MNTTLIPCELSGSVSAIPSKSDAHRLLICAALSDKPTDIVLKESSDDIDTTADCLTALGAEIKPSRGVFTVIPTKGVTSSPYLDCKESGSTLRFLLPVAAALSECARFSGRGRLPDRPITELRSAMEKHGVQFSSKHLPFYTIGKLSGGDFYIPGNVSSQYLTGILLALPLCGGGSLHVTTAIESLPYVEMTLHALSRFGIEYSELSDGWSIGEAQHYKSPGVLYTDGDWSNASFFLAAGAIRGSITVTGLYTSSLQGDKVVCDILKRFGAEVLIDGSSVTVSHRSLHSCEVDLKNIPDMLPILAVVAAFSDGTSVFTGGKRLRLKESDRLASTASMINSMGGSAEETEDGLIIRGTGSLTGGTVDGMNDHRIVMAAAIAAAYASGETTITGSEAVSKSYPPFWEDYVSLSHTSMQEEK